MTRSGVARIVRQVASGHNAYVHTVIILSMNDDLDQRNPAEYARIGFDVESFPDWFMVCFLCELPDGEREVRMFESTDRDGLPVAERREIMDIMAKAPQLVSYNGTRYDVPMLRKIVTGAAPDLVNATSNELVTGRGKPAYLKGSPERHIDCERLVVGMRGLKELAAMLHMEDISELPSDPSKPVGDEATKRRLREYCLVDCENTLNLHDHLHDAVELRRTLNKKYDLGHNRTGGFSLALESQIGEKLIAAKCGDARPLPSKIEIVHWHGPEFLSFNDPAAQSLLDSYRSANIEAHPGGGVKLPPSLRETAAAFNYEGTNYLFGVGGLHSTQKEPIFVRSEPGELEIRDYDVASYYPSILLGANADPVDGFCDAYRDMVEQRLEAKRQGDVHEAAALKIAINGVFGKLKQPGSAVYSPSTFVDVVATGQFALMMLVEQLTEAGADVLSANTDGVIVAVDPRITDLDGSVDNWCEKTGFVLERTDYNTLAMRDVNNYVAITPDGSVKAKGAYSAGSSILRTRPAFDVCAEAALGWIADGVPPAQHIAQCDDLRKFLTVRKMTGGVVDEQGNHYGKVVRYYKSDDARRTLIVPDGKNGRLVPDGKGAIAVPLLQGDPPPLPDDIDRQFYIDRAVSMVAELGDRSVQKTVSRSQSDMFDDLF